MNDGIYLKEPATVSVLAVMTEHSRDTVFYDSNGDEYLRIGADNVPADVYERFTSWCMHLPPVHDAEVRRLTAENAEMQEQLNKNPAQIKILEERIEHLEGDYDHYESFDEGYRSAGADLEIAKRMLANEGLMDFLRNLEKEDYPVQAAEELYNSFK